MKKAIIISTIVLISILGYLFFEPIMIYNIGWKTFPDTQSLRPREEYKDAIEEKADSLLKVIYTKLHTPAVSMAVGKQGKVVWTNTIGYADIQKNILAGLDTKFRIGSTSKAVTSVGVGVLLERKKLTLRSNLKDFVPYAKDHLKELTLAQLASHTSGIRNYGFCWCFPIWEYYSNEEYITVKESIEVFGADKLLFEPGTDFNYSTYNYTLLSAMLEGASKMSFPEFMKLFVFEPLGIKNIIAENSIHDEKTAIFYNIEGNRYKQVFKVNNSNKWAGGGLLATSTALVKLGNAFLKQKLFPKEITKTLTTPIYLINGEVNEQNYAIGWRNDITTKVFDDNRKTEIWHHAGKANGATSLLILFPEYNLSISILMNKSGSVSELFEFSYLFANIFSAQTRYKGAEKQ